MRVRQHALGLLPRGPTRRCHSATDATAVWTSRLGPPPAGAASEDPARLFEALGEHVRCGLRLPARLDAGEPVRDTWPTLPEPGQLEAAVANHLAEFIGLPSRFRWHLAGGPLPEPQPRSPGQASGFLWGSRAPLGDGAAPPVGTSLSRTSRTYLQLKERQRRRDADRAASVAVTAAPAPAAAAAAAGSGGGGFMHTSAFESVLLVLVAAKQRALGRLQTTTAMGGASGHHVSFSDDESERRVQRLVVYVSDQCDTQLIPLAARVVDIRHVRVIQTVYAATFASSSSSDGAARGSPSLQSALRLRPTDAVPAADALPDHRNYAVFFGNVVAAIAEDVGRGLFPCLLCCQYGAPYSAAVDPLASLKALCERVGLWMHIDGSSAGLAAATPLGKAVLRRTGADEAHAMAGPLGAALGTAAGGAGDAFGALDGASSIHIAGAQRSLPPFAPMDHAWARDGAAPQHYPPLAHASLAAASFVFVADAAEVLAAWGGADGCGVRSATGPLPTSWRSGGGAAAAPSTGVSARLPYARGAPSRLATLLPWWLLLQPPHGPASPREVLRACIAATQVAHAYLAEQLRGSTCRGMFVCDLNTALFGKTLLRLRLQSDEDLVDLLRRWHHALDAAPPGPSALRDLVHIDAVRIQQRVFLSITFGSGGLPSHGDLDELARRLTELAAAPAVSH